MDRARPRAPAAVGDRARWRVRERHRNRREHRRVARGAGERAGGRRREQQHELPAFDVRRARRRGGNADPTGPEPAALGGAYQRRPRPARRDRPGQAPEHHAAGAGVSPFTRGFTGRGRAADPRLPPGQYDVGRTWPVLTAEATPKLDTSTWTFTVEGLVAHETTWTWDEIQALPQSSYDGAIHCVTTWSKFEMQC